jgi:hypothetical protein
LKDRLPDAGAQIRRERGGDGTGLEYQDETVEKRVLLE